MRKLLHLLVWTLLILGGVIGLGRATAIRWWKVPTDDAWLGASVSPSIRPGEWVILWRLSRPDIGDLVMCPEPGAPERIVIGRVLGTGNDTVEVNGQAVILNTKTLRKESHCDEFEVIHPKTGQPTTQTCSVEDLSGDLYQRGNLVPGLTPPPKMTPVKVLPGKFFLVSDNRQFPLDSRDFGLVDAESCRETVIFRLLGAGGYFDSNRRFELVR